MDEQLVHLYHRHGAVWCGFGIAEVENTRGRDAATATCQDCLVIAERFKGADLACQCWECRG